MFFSSSTSSQTHVSISVEFRSSRIRFDLISFMTIQFELILRELILTRMHKLTQAKHRQASKCHRGQTMIAACAQFHTTQDALQLACNVIFLSNRSPIASSLEPPQSLATCILRLKYWTGHFCTSWSRREIERFAPQGYVLCPAFSRAIMSYLLFSFSHFRRGFAFRFSF